MKAPELAVAGNPGIVLARVAPTLLSLMGADGCVLGGGTVLAARWRHRVSTDIDLFTDHERYQERLGSLPRDRSISEPIRDPTYPNLVPDLARRAGRLFDVDDWRGRTRR